MAISGVVWADLVKEVCQDVGAGALVLGGAVSGFRSFGDVVGEGEDFPYAILGVSVPGEWETGIGSLDGEGRLVRTAGASSAGGDAVDFSAGAKLVVLTPTADWLAAVDAHGHGISEVEGLGAALAGKQAASGELSAIAALATTGFGRGVLGQADAAALRGYAAAVAKAGDTMSGALVVSGDGAGANIANERFQDAAASPTYICRKARGSAASPAAVSQNDILGNNQNLGWSGSGFVNAAELRFVVTAATPSASDMEAEGRFRACGPGSVTLADVLTYSVANGLVVVGPVRPSTDNARTLGAASYRWSVVYAATGTINTSDAREKRDVGAMSDALLDAWGGVDWRTFRWRDAFAEKGEAARWHFGLVAQAVRDAIDGAMGAGAAVRLGLVCHDVWDEISEQVSEGEVMRAHRPAGDRWGLRYEECFAVEAAWQRREIGRLRDLVDVAG